MYATLTSSKISFQDKTIVIELNNEVQKEMLVNIKQDMLDELRKLVSNKQMQLEIKVSEILELTNQKPVFGHISGKRANTHWITFMNVNMEESL